jgi:tetratricopeptide (TPR) repeat protein
MKLAFAITLFVAVAPPFAQDEHSHPAPEKLGAVSFPTTCSPAVQSRFERAVALLHSFAYAASEKAFRDIAKSDPQCAMAHWGIAMTYFHELWEPQITSSDLKRGLAELREAQQLTANRRERDYIAALTRYYRDSDNVPATTRGKLYEEAMANVAKANPSDSEAQIFYALALLGTASPMDKTHPNEKHAAAILEPLHKRFPQHPGIVHYLIHSYDSTDLAHRGLDAAREYAKIAPSAPHALHMPSHIFTRLGLWDESIASNVAARAAAQQQGDVGEELHAMDYLTYAYLQRGHDADAARVLKELNSKSELAASDFKISYAATAMPVRYAVERQQWAEAAKIQSITGAPPHVTAITYWARAVGLVRSGQPEMAESEITELQRCYDQLKASGNSYWLTQVHVQLLEAQAWTANARGKSSDAVSMLRKAAAEEDAVEKLPVTPGPIIPAREQLADLLLTLNRPKEALAEFESSLTEAPRRRGALIGAARAAELLGEKTKAEQFRTTLR